MDETIIVEFVPEYAPAAARLVLESYRRERCACPYLPEEPFDNAGTIEAKIRRLARGIAAIDHQGLAGFMLDGYRFPFKNTIARLVPEIGHAVRAGQGTELYNKLYPALARRWPDASLHIIGAMAHDTGLSELLYTFGFGAVITERLRNLDPPTGSAGNEDNGSADGDTTARYMETDFIRWESDIEKIVPLQIRHAGYYSGSPVYVEKSTDPIDGLSFLRRHQAHGAEFLVCGNPQVPEGCFILAPAPDEGEGMLLRGTNTGELKSAYLAPNMRKQGIGTEMLRRVIQRAGERGFDRLFVEHETANVSGREFWSRHFTSFVRFSMRYVELPGS